LITVILGFGISKLESRNSFDGELPNNDPIIVQYEIVREHFDKRPAVLIGIEADNIYSPETLRKIVTITKAAEKIPFVLKDEIKSLATVENIRSETWGIEFHNFLDSIPQDQKTLRVLQEQVMSNNLVYGKLVSKDHKLAIIAANLEDDFEGEAVFLAANSIVEQMQGPETIHVTGAPILVEEVQQGISGDTSKLIPIAIIIVFFGFHFCFRKARATLLPAVMVILSIVWTLGFMGYCQLPMTVVSNALPVIMVAVASSYGIHFMYSYYYAAEDSTSSKEAVEKALDKVASPILITGITSALGSASLLIFKITSLKEFGIIGAAGFVFATIICLSFLPASCSLMKLQRNNPYRFAWFVGFAQKFSKKSFDNKTVIIGIYLTLVLVFAYFGLKINIGDDYTKFFPSNHKGRIASDVFNDHLSGVRIMDIMLDAGEGNTIKSEEFAGRLAAFEMGITQLKHVGEVNSYLDVVKHIQENFEGGSTFEELELSSEKLSQYLMLFEMSSDPGDLYVLMDQPMQRTKLQVFIKSSKPEDHKAIYDQVTRLFQIHFKDSDTQLALGGDVVNRISLVDYIVSGKVQNIALSILIVLLTCAFLFRSLKKGLITIVPIVSSLIMIFGCMGLLGIRLGISTALLTAMVVGIGIDFSVHYLSGFYRNKERRDLNNEQALDQTASHVGRAIFFDAISNIVGFSVLSFSGFLPVQHFGWLLAFSMLLIFLNTIIFYPALFAIFQNKSVTKTNVIAT
jgi:predicted RND superfamily exporter protein